MGDEEGKLQLGKRNKNHLQTNLWIGNEWGKFSEKVWVPKKKKNDSDSFTTRLLQGVLEDSHQA